MIMKQSLLLYCCIFSLTGLIFTTSSCIGKFKKENDHFIYGVLYDEFGDPLANAEILLEGEHDDMGFYRSRFCEEDFMTKTDDNGRFTLRFKDDCGGEDESSYTFTVYNSDGTEIPYYFNHRDFRKQPKQVKYATFYGYTDFDKLNEKYNDQVPFYPGALGSSTHKVKFMVDLLDQYNDQDTVFIVKPLTFRDYTTGVYDGFFRNWGGLIQFEQHPYEVLKYVPARDGKQFEYSFYQPTRLTASHRSFNAGLYPNAVFYTCDSRKAHVFENFNSYYLVSENDHSNRIAHLREKFSVVEYEAGSVINEVYGIDIVLQKKCDRARIK